MQFRPAMLAEFVIRPPVSKLCNNFAGRIVLTHKSVLLVSMDAAATRSRSLLQLGRWSLSSAIVALFVMSLLLAARRFAGSHRPLDPASAILLAVFLAGGAALLRLVWRRTAILHASHRLQFAAWILPTAFVALTSLALFTSGSSTAALLIAWLVVIGEEGFMLWHTRPQRHTSPTRERGTGDAANPSLAGRASVLPATATQSLVSTIEDDGTHVVAGTLRARFKPGERTAVIHVGFCPPLPALPHFECEQTDGPEAEFKLAQLLTHGARLDVRLRLRPEDAAVVELEFHAAAKDE